MINSASLQDPIIYDGCRRAAEATVEGRIIDAQRAGRVKGVAEMPEGQPVAPANGETVVLTPVGAAAR